MTERWRDRDGEYWRLHSQLVFLDPDYFSERWFGEGTKRPLPRYFDREVDWASAAGQEVEVVEFRDKYTTPRLCSAKLKEAGWRLGDEQSKWRRVHHPGQRQHNALLAAAQGPWIRRPFDEDQFLGTVFTFFKPFEAA